MVEVNPAKGFRDWLLPLPMQSAILE